MMVECGLPLKFRASKAAVRRWKRFIVFLKRLEDGKNYVQPVGGGLIKIKKAALKFCYEYSKAAFKKVGREKASVKG